MKKVSAVVACYNEEKHIKEMHERLTDSFKKAGVEGQIVFVENGSVDESLVLLKKIASQDPRVTVVVMARNFGSQGAFTAGMDYADGDAVILMDGDLQDPPELIPELVEKWHEGYEVVYGFRERRKGSLSRRIAYKIFYRLFKKLSYIDIPLDAGDFGLMDKKVADVVRAMPERNRYLRGLRAWAGFRSVGVPYTRFDRKYGETTNSFLDNVRWAMLAIFSFSYKPLEWISALSFFVTGIAGVSILFYIFSYFFSGSAPQGFSTLIVVVLFMGSIQLLCLSIIGQYLGRMFEEVKQRPRYIIRNVLNDPNE